jgi:hypothetical protein
MQRTYPYRGFEVTIAVVRGVKPRSFVALVGTLDPQTGRTLPVQRVAGEPGQPFQSEAAALTAGFTAAQWAIDDALAQRPSQPE